MEQNQEQLNKIARLSLRRDVLYQWYVEKNTRGFHKEFTFEQLKEMILHAEAELEAATRELLDQ